MKFICFIFLMILADICVPRAYAAEEVILFNRDGAAVAYIDSGDLSIYLWNGEPVAYLQRDGATVFNAFGFNGRHLGWYANGVLYGHDGDASCAIAARLSNVQDPGPRNPRQLLRLKTTTEPVPRRPSFYNAFSPVPCDALLEYGASR